MSNAVPSVKKLHSCSTAIETSIKIEDILTFRDQMVVALVSGRFVSGFSFIDNSFMLVCLPVFSVQYGGEPFAWPPKVVISTAFVLFFIIETHTHRKHESGKS